MYKKIIVIIILIQMIIGIPLGVIAGEKINSLDTEGVKSDEKNINILENNVISNVNLTLDKASGVNVGTEINMTAKAVGGGNVEYQYWVKKEGHWYIVKDYSTDTTFKYTPKKSGDYRFTVRARTVGSNKAYEALKGIDFKVNEPTPITGVEVNLDKESGISAGTEINMTAKVVGGSNAEYQYWVRDKNGWSIVKNYSTDTTFSYIPEEAGDYRFTVRARTVGSKELYEALKGIDFKVNEPTPITGVEVNLDKESGVSAGTEINMTAKVVGGSNAEYQYWVRDKNGWSIVKDYSTDTTLSYTPEEAGDYRFTVRVRRVGSKESYEALKGLDFKVVKNIVEKVELNIDKPNGAKAGTEINMTAKAVGGINVEYQYWVRDKNGWSVVKDYSTDTTLSYTPKEAGDYRFTVRARTVGSKELYEVLKGIDFKVNENMVEKVELSIDKESGVSAGTSIKLIAESIGSNFPEYKFLVERNGEIEVIKDYGDQNEAGYYISESGNYNFIVKARTKGKKVDYESLYQMEYQVIDNIKSIDINLDKPSGIASGIPIQITSNVVSVNSNIEYQYWVKKDGHWNIVKDYSTDRTFTYTPKEAGDYRFTVRVRTRGSSLAYEALKGVDYKIVGMLSFFNNKYNIRYENFLAKQMNNNPQDYYYGSGWDSANLESTDYYLNPNNFLQFLNEKYKYDIIKVIKVKSDVSALNVRKEATVESEKVDLIHSDEIYPMFDTKNGWYKIKTDNSEGWIHGAYANEYFKPRNTDLRDIISSNEVVSEKQETENLFPIKIATDVLNVRQEATTNSSILTQVKYDEIYIVLDKVDNWYKIKANNKIGWIFSNYTITTNQVPREMYQFLDLSGSSYLTESQLNIILKGKGILEGKGSSFIKAGRLYNINEIYLISHALLETGNCTSTLATGVKVNDRKVYNMYGIGAYDSNPIGGGSETAYKYGWFTPEQAIVGGAKFISEKYVNNPNYKQNTLYKMRWNPDKPTVHQYATDIGWSYKQTSNIKKLYELSDTYSLRFEIPEYLN